MKFQTYVQFPSTLHATVFGHIRVFYISNRDNPCKKVFLKPKDPNPYPHRL
ncbi:uncharacterized protein METZ01_LOCUS491033, partial [marine metagenome]